MKSKINVDIISLCLVRLNLDRGLLVILSFLKRDIDVHKKNKCKLSKAMKNLACNLDEEY